MWWFGVSIVMLMCDFVFMLKICIVVLLFLVLIRFCFSVKGMMLLSMFL